jgi:hypothetical protein
MTVASHLVPDCLAVPFAAQADTRPRARRIAVRGDKDTRLVPWIRDF